MENPPYINNPDAIVAAAWDNFGELVEKLLDGGANINIQDEFGNTALIAASQQEYGGIVKFLLERGADPNIKDKDGDTALDVARYRENNHIVDLLKSCGAKGKDGPSEKEKQMDNFYDSCEKINEVKFRKPNENSTAG